MVVYADVIFLLNFILDFFLVWMTGIVLRQSTRIWRIALSACIGTFYTFLLFFPWLQFSWSILAKFLLSVAMIGCAFRWHGPLEFMKRLLVFYLVSCLLGGSAYAIAFLLGSQANAGAGFMVLSGGQVFTTNILFIAIVVAPVFVWFGWKKFWQHLRHIRRQADGIWTVSISVAGKELSCTGLLDTGNGLLDPISKQPVTVVTYSALKSILPQNLIDRMEQDPTKIVAAITEIDYDDDWMSRFRLIPFRTVGVSSAIMVAFQPDCVRISRDGQEKIINRTLIGIGTQALSKTEAYDAILHPMLVA